MFPFDIEKQTTDLTSKLVSSLELFSQVFRINLWDLQKEHKISPIQIQILIFIHYHKKELCTVTELADEFNMTKATVSDSVRVLEKKGFLSKEKDSEDHRISYIKLTSDGKNVLEHFGSYSSELYKSIDKLPDQSKTIIFKSFVSIISELQKNNVINERRMCSNCFYYSPSGKTNYTCNLLEEVFSQEKFRMDCPDFKGK